MFDYGFYPHYDEIFTPKVMPNITAPDDSVVIYDEGKFSCFYGSKINE